MKKAYRVLLPLLFWTGCGSSPRRRWGRSSSSRPPPCGGAASPGAVRHRGLLAYRRASLGRILLGLPGRGGPGNPAGRAHLCPPPGRTASLSPAVKVIRPPRGLFSSSWCCCGWRPDGSPASSPPLWCCLWCGETSPGAGPRPIPSSWSWPGLSVRAVADPSAGHVPSVLPYFASGCPLALGLAWKAGVAAEVLCLPPRPEEGRRSTRYAFFMPQPPRSPYRSVSRRSRIHRRGCHRHRWTEVACQAPRSTLDDPLDLVRAVICTPGRTWDSQLGDLSAGGDLMPGHQLRRRRQGRRLYNFGGLVVIGGLHRTGFSY